MMVDAIAIIPARGGSKGVPGKNKRVIGGKPLIMHSIDAAKAARCLGSIVVTTDDEDILALAAAAEVVAVHRPAELAGDSSPVTDAVAHALASIGEPDVRSIVLLQPTSPLRTGEDIDRAVALHRAKGLPVCSVYRVEDAHPARMYRTDDGILDPLFPDLAEIRRQDLPPVFHRNGAIYVFGPDEVARRQIITARMAAYEMPAERSANIDSELDVIVLQAILDRS